MYAKDTIVTFDLLTHRAGADGNVQIGCQTVAVADLLAASTGEFIRHADGSVTASAIKGTADGRGNVVFLDGKRSFTEDQVQEYARNLTTEAPVAPWQDGDVVVTTPLARVSSSRPRGVRVRVRGEWLRADGSTLGPLDTDATVHPTVDARVSSDVDKGYYTVLYRGDGSIKVGDRVALVGDPVLGNPSSVLPIGAPGTVTEVSENGSLRVLFDGRPGARYYVWPESTPREERTRDRGWAVRRAV